MPIVQMCQSDISHHYTGISYHISFYRTDDMGNNNFIIYIYVIYNCRLELKRLNVTMHTTLTIYCP